MKLGLFVSLLLGASLTACSSTDSDASAETSTQATNSTEATSCPGATDAGPTATDAASHADAGPNASDAASNIVVVDVGGTGMSFSPSEVTIHAGDSVRWQWGAGRHNVVSGTVEDGVGIADGKFCSPGGASCDQAPPRRAPFAFDTTFTSPGDYPFFCTPHIHMGMVGVIHVLR